MLKILFWWYIILIFFYVCKQRLFSKYSCVFTLQTTIWHFLYHLTELPNPTDASFSPTSITASLLKETSTSSTFNWLMLYSYLQYWLFSQLLDSEILVSVPVEWQQSFHDILLESLINWDQLLCSSSGSKVLDNLYLKWSCDLMVQAPSLDFDYGWSTPKYWKSNWFTAAPFNDLAQKFVIHHMIFFSVHKEGRILPERRIRQ